MLGNKTNLNKKLLIDRIWKDTKYQIKQTKSSLTNSTTTQASPNQDKAQYLNLTNFFKDFQFNCKISYTPVQPPPKLPLRRNLKAQFMRVNYECNRDRCNTQWNKYIQKQQGIQKHASRKVGVILRQKSSKSIIKPTSIESQQKLRNIRKQLKQIYNSRKLPISLNQKPALKRCASIKF